VLAVLLQPPSGCQAGNAGADHSDSGLVHTAHRQGVAWTEKAVQLPGAKEGGREEEEKRPEVSAGRTGRLHSRKGIQLESRIAGLAAGATAKRLNATARVSAAWRESSIARGLWWDRATVQADGEAMGAVPVELVFDKSMVCILDSSWRKRKLLSWTKMVFVELNSACPSPT